MFRRSLVVLALPAVIATATLFAASGATEPQVIDDATLKAVTTTVGGADVLPTTRTIPHWWGSTTDPHNGVTYGYNMAGANPNTCSGTDCSVTIEADITPILVRVGGLVFDGNAVLAATRASGYHLILHPNVMAPVVIDVPNNQGTPLRSGRGVIFADIDIVWWSSQIQNLNSTQDPTHLAIYLTDNVIYSFMGDLNQFAGFRMPATGCN